MKLHSALSILSTAALLSAGSSFAQDLVPVYQSLSNQGDYMLTLTQFEGSPTYRDLGLAFFLSDDASEFDDYVGLFRCNIPSTNDHFVSTDPNCEGATTEYLYGYASPTPIPGLVPLYRYYNPQTREHYVTTFMLSEVPLGYYQESIMGFVYPGYETSVVQNVPVPGPVIWPVRVIIGHPVRHAPVIRRPIFTPHPHPPIHPAPRRPVVVRPPVVVHPPVRPPVVVRPPVNNGRPHDNHPPVNNGHQNNGHPNNGGHSDHQPRKVGPHRG